MDELRHAAATLVADPPLPPTPVSELQARNRRRHGRRRLVGAAAAVLVALVGVSLVRADPDHHVVAAGVGDGGRLALPSTRGAVLVDGDGGGVVPVDLGRPAQLLTWSADGEWLALAANGTLWLVRRDGTDLRLVPVPGVGPVSWLPTGHRLLVAVDSAPEPGQYLVDPDEPAPVRFNVGGSATWSPDGRRMAYLDEGGELHVADRDGSHAELVGRTGELPSSAAGIWVAGFSPDGRWLLYWGVPFTSASLGADGYPLVAIELGGDRTQVTLDTMLADPSWLQWSPDGTELLTVAGDGRFLLTPRTIKRCDLAAHRCDALPVPDGMTAYDPAWSPDGTRIAFIAGPTTQGADLSAARVASRLWTMAADGSDAHPVEGASPGVSRPAWSADGTALVTVTALGMAEAGRSSVRVERVDAGGGGHRVLAEIELDVAAMGERMQGRAQVPQAWSPAAASTRHR